MMQKDPAGFPFHLLRLEPVKPLMKTHLWFTVVCVLLLRFAATLAQGAANEGAWKYTLLDGSTLLDDCPICGRPSIAIPLRGTFELNEIPSPAPLRRYEIRGVDFVAANGSGREYRLKGTGTYEVMEEFAIIQRLRLDLVVDDSFTTTEVRTGGNDGIPGRLWPMMSATSVQTNGTFTREFHFTLNAAPLRALWFTIPAGLSSGRPLQPTNRVGPGDVMTHSGDIFRRYAALTSALQIPSSASDPGVDALGVLPGGEIVFSLSQPVKSASLGALSEGALVSDRGRLVKANSTLLGPFGAMPPTPDVGLDAIQSLDAGEFYFSIRTPLFSEKLGTTLGKGDLLSSQGRVIRSNKELLARFHPSAKTGDVGLDAFYVWPSGEVWFSTEDSFEDSALGHLGHGDILSDSGYVVFRNLELLRPFAPLEDLADFGLASLFIVTDASASPKAPQLGAVGADKKTGDLRLQWQGAGRVFQLERAGWVDGQFAPITGIDTLLEFRDKGAILALPVGFYRIRSW